MKPRTIAVTVWRWGIPGLALGWGGTVLLGLYGASPEAGETANISSRPNIPGSKSPSVSGGSLESQCQENPRHVIGEICPRLPDDEAAEYAALAARCMAMTDVAAAVQALASTNDLKIFKAGIATLAQMGDGVRTRLLSSIPGMANGMALALQDAVYTANAKETVRSQGVKQALAESKGGRELHAALVVSAEADSRAALDWLTENPGRMPGFETKSAFQDIIWNSKDRKEVMSWLAGRDLTLSTAHALNDAAESWAFSDTGGFTEWFSTVSEDVQNRILTPGLKGRLKNYDPAVLPRIIKTFTVRDVGAPQESDTIK